MGKVITRRSRKSQALTCVPRAVSQFRHQVLKTSDSLAGLLVPIMRPIVDCILAFLLRASKDAPIWLATSCTSTARRLPITSKPVSRTSQYINTS